MSINRYAENRGETAMNRIVKTSMFGALMGTILATSGCAGRDGVTASLASATTYRERESERFAQGYHDEALGNGRYKIEAEVSAVSPREDAVAIAKVRAAELAKESGFTHFAVLSVRHLSNCVGTVQGGTHTGMPRVEMTIQLLETPPAGAERGVYEADAVLTELRTHVMAPNYSYEQKLKNVEINREACYRGTPVLDEAS